MESMIPDTINGSFEFLGGFFIFLSAKKVYEDKQVKGIHWLTIAFFALWGYWNVYYYPYLGQWVSFVGGISVSLSNTVYVYLLLYYGRKNVT